jgi:hypothetical protein
MPGGPGQDGERRGGEDGAEGAAESCAGLLATCDC